MELDPARWRACELARHFHTDCLFVMYNSTMLAPLAALALSAKTPVVWYGPATVSFKAPYQGNPYDPTSNDAWVEFEGASGVIRRPAFYDQGLWKAVLVSKKRGAYRASLTLNGKPNGGAKAVQLDSKIRDGYVRLGGTWGFMLDSGKPYWPLGHNLGWQPVNGFPDLTDFMADMAKNGVNWTRIWACTWDNKNPWWPGDKTKIEIGKLWTPAIARWDALVHAAEVNNIRFQFVLFHHGQWSSTTDSNWADNPWNAKNGGFLRNPADFFSDARAKALSREWIRYAIARWGHSPAIMSWELFNEVQWVDAVRQNRQAEVGKWHDNMADYVRSLDPVGHLVTTSSEMSLPIWRKMDYYQPHGYPARVQSMVLSAERVDKRPFFFGEVGPGSLYGSNDVQTLAVKDGIWGGLISLDSGAAQYWTWDLVPRYHLHNQFRYARKILADSKVLAESGLKKIAPDLGVSKGALLRLLPGGGWEATRQYEFSLPEQAGDMGNVSSYFQGTGHAEMRTRPLTFMFNAPSPGAFSVNVTGVSGTGGEIIVKINGVEKARKAFAGGTKIQTPEKVTAEFPAGNVMIELDNKQADWVQLGAMDFPGIGLQASAVGIGNARSALMRIERAAGMTVRIVPSKLTLADGGYNAVLTDLDTGKETRFITRVAGGTIPKPIEIPHADSILWLRRRTD